MTSSTQTVAAGRFGRFGGRYVPETLVPALEALEQAYARLADDVGFQRELAAALRHYCGRPTPLYFAPRLSQRLGTQVFLKREDLLHTGAHKINNALGQVFLARRMGKRRVIAETGAGQHGVATATAAAVAGLSCDVYMGTEDMARQRLNVVRMRLLGARVVPVESGSRTLKDAINEALRDWVTNVDTTFYVIGSVVGPHPYPTLVRDFQAIIGREARTQILHQVGRLPDVVVACVGGGSNALGLFHAFRDDPVRLIGVEAGGEGLASGRHAATLTAGTPGVLHGAMSYLLQDADGQVLPTHSISAGLDYPGVGPEHAWLKETGRAEYVAADDRLALEGFQLLAQTEGILPALEPAHAIGYLQRLAPTLPRDAVAAARALAACRPREIDLGLVNGRYFLTIAGVGFDGEVASRVNRWPKVVGGTALYVAGILATLATYTPVEVDLDVDGTRTRQRVFLIAVANTAWNAGGMWLVPAARPDDGFLDAVIAGALGRWETLAVLPRVFAGTHVHHGKVRQVRARVIRVDGPRWLTVQADGELVGPLPATFSVQPRALTVLAP